MDSLTQIVLGAGVGELVLGKKLGNKAQLMGAIAGTIPDLDVLLTPLMANDLAYLKLHRSYSHALFTHILLAFPLAWLCFKIFKQQISYKSLYLLWFLGLATHALLDCCTTYGTQFFLPFSSNLVGFNNINIIDPMYTLPFMVCLIVCLFLKKGSVGRIRWANVAMIISCFYMALTFVSKYAAHNKFTKELKLQNIVYDNLSTTPAILNNILWSGIATTDSTLIIGEYSHLQKQNNIEFVSYARNMQLLNNIGDKDIANTLSWFAQGKSMITQTHPDTLQFYAAKWGRADFKKKEPMESFIFYYLVYKDKLGKWGMTAIQPTDKFSFKQAWNDLWTRVFDY
jgi:inner membrane protein